MSVNDAFHIAVLPGDGIGPEVMAPALEVLRAAAALMPGLRLAFSEAPAGAGHYRDTGTSLPEATAKLCEQADAILLGACGLPHIRYPDNTEIMPQVELRFIFDLYAGVRPCRLVPGIPSPIVGAADRGIDLVVIRGSTEGLFASMGKGIVTDDEARETLVITRRLRSACLISPSVWRGGARRAAGAECSPASTRRTHSRRTPSFEKCSMRARRAFPKWKPTTSTSTPARPCWCASRGTSTCW